VFPRRFAWRFPLALGLGFAATFMLQDPYYVSDQWQGWWHYLRISDTDLLPRDVWYRDFRLLCNVVGVPLDAEAYRLTQVVAGGLIAGVCLVRKWFGESRRHSLRTVFVLGSCWMTLFGPATESSTYILLAPALAATVLAVREPCHPAWSRYLILAAFVLLLVAQAAVWFPSAKHFHALGPQPLAVVLLLLGLLAWLPPRSWFRIEQFWHPPLVWNREIRS
jgi:hypothetical protein